MNRYLKNIGDLIFSLLAIILVHVTIITHAQENNDTLERKLGDLLVQFPAESEAEYERLMSETARLGQPGILEMAHMFTAEGDNSKLEYALGGLSFYVTQPRNEALRLMASNAYAEALGAVNEEEIKVFFISQLQRVGQEEAVAELKKYLSTEGCCGPAARALVGINTPSAQRALLEGLTAANGTCQYALIEALGDVRNRAALGALENLMGSSDVKTRKLVLYALAKIGDPTSEDILAEQAEAAGFKLNATNATAAYFLWARRMIQSGNARAVEKLTKKLLKTLNEEGQVHSKTAALKLYADSKGEDAISQLIKAATSDTKELRAAAFKFAAPMSSDKINEAWLKQLKKADGERKAEILMFLADRKGADAYEAVVKYLGSENPEIKRAAIRASSKLGVEKAVAMLLEILETADVKEIEAVKVSLLTNEGSNVPSEIVKALPRITSPAAKAALLDVLASRKASTHGGAVFSLINHDNAQVRSAAFRALPHVSTEENLSSLYSLLVSANNDEEVALTQAAIINALDARGNTQSTKAIMHQMTLAPSDKRYMYYNILARIGTDDALSAVVSEFQEGNALAKKAAINALENWEGFSAGRELLKIVRASSGSEHFDQLLSAYIQQVQKSAQNDMNKYLLLREAMEIASTVDQKAVILRHMGESPALPAFFYAARFLDDDDVKRVAAEAITNIVQDNEGFYGEEVRSILEKTIARLEGPESAYLKESLRNHLENIPEGPGFVRLFNGKDLNGWKGLVGNPLKRAEMSQEMLKSEQKKADEKMRESWIVADGKLVFTGKGHNISTEKKYGDFEMYLDWKIEAGGDAGIYLRGTPQVQIWDPTRTNVGAQVGSGGLYNNKQYASKPLRRSDNPVGEWNNFRITMVGDKVTVYLNGELVVDNVVLENYWDRDQAIFPADYIELQAHGSRVEYRDIYLREISGSEPFVLSEEEKAEGFEVLFDGTNLDSWIGNKTDYIIENGELVIRPAKGPGGNLYTKDEYSDFIFRFEFQLTPGANNGLSIRTSLENDAPIERIELQILDNTADIYKELKAYQYHGSVYGLVPAKRGHLKPVGEWNYQEVIVDGPNVKVILNGNVIVDTNIVEEAKRTSEDGKIHPKFQRPSGHIGFLGHGSVVKFRNIRVKETNNER